jgi:hypothetical protein
MSTAEWTEGDLLAQARANANATILATFAYLKQRRQQDEWIQAIGEMFTPAWEQAKGENALQLARRAAFNPVSLGGTLVSLEGNEDQAIAVVKYPRDMAESFGIPIEEVASLYTTVYQAVFKSLGVNFASKIDGDRWTYTVTI